jgi:S-methylmethionine-dependent homocysteine/selenocysteine methylase
MQNGTRFLADGGLETAMIFHEGLDLPEFASFTLLDSAKGRGALRRYFHQYIASAQAHGMGFLIDTATWRANPDWGRKLGLDVAAVQEVNKKAVAFAKQLRTVLAEPGQSLLINGVIGPQGDGYNPETYMTAEQAEAYHTAQIAALAEAGVDVVAGITLCYPEEAIGIARAAKKHGLDCFISFTVETDGKLISGYSLREAIERVDAETDSYPLFFMINCAHPDHFIDALRNGETWIGRIGGVRANASRMSHAELDNAEELDEGNPGELAMQYKELTGILPNLRVLGGCCGTDHRHVAAIGHLCAVGIAA